MKDSEYLKIIHDRFVDVYNESKDAHFLIKMREIIDKIENDDKSFDDYLKFVESKRKLMDKSKSMGLSERQIKITEIISKFSNGEELYKRNAVFNKVIQMLVEDMDVYYVLEQVTLSAEQTQRAFEDYMFRDTRPINLNQ